MWTPKEKELSLAMYYRSPRQYKAFEKMGFKLPSVRTVQRWVSVLRMKAGIDNAVIKQFSIFVKTMSEMEKKCVVIFDEMTIKKWVFYDKEWDFEEGLQDLGEFGSRNSEQASHVLVFMVHGLTYNWKLTVAYYLSAGPIKAEMLEKVWRSVVSELLKIGLDVKASVCDQGAPNRTMFKNLGVTVNKPFINLNGKKIYAFSIGFTY